MLLLKNFATVVENYYDEDAFLAVRDELKRRGVKPSDFYMGMAVSLMENIHEQPIKNRQGKHLFLYRFLKEKHWMDEAMYLALKEDFYFAENKYIGGILPVDDPELGRQAVVDFLKSHPDFVPADDPLKASKQVRGITLGATRRYIYYEKGKYKNHMDERKDHGQ